MSVLCTRLCPYKLDDLHLSVNMAITTSQLSNLTGTWLKDEVRSDSLDQAVKLMQLGGLVRQAMKLMRGLEITHTHDTFNMAVFSIFEWFKVKETYVLNGSTPTLCKRRDLRSGRHTGTAHVKHGKVQLNLSWSDPFSGSGLEEYHLNEPDELCVRSTIKVQGGETVYTTIYHRKRT